MAEFNRVTEKTRNHARELWIVSAEWHGGHDRRLFRLENVHFSESAARADFNQLTAEKHNTDLGRPADFDSGFKRLPMRHFREVDPADNFQK